MSDVFYDALGCLPQKEVHFDIADARQIPRNTQNVPASPAEDAVKNKFALETTQDMVAFEYNMNHKHRGVAIIFNHFEFNDSSLEKRFGTDKDVDALLETLPLLGFRPDHIIVEHDLPKGRILGYSYNVAASRSEILENCDCIAIFILSHGSKGNKIYARDGDYDLYRLVELYTPNNFEALAAKPKLFFINACRGDNIDDGVQLRPVRQRASHLVTDTVDSVSDNLIFSHPVHADILISMSSHHEHLSFRNVMGSWYIQDLCTTIKRFKERNVLHTSDITELLLYTHYLVSQRESQSDGIQLRGKKQIPNFNSALCRKLCFTTKP